MKFKTWFAEYGGGLGAATSVIHGGLGDPFSAGNSNMPFGVRSKIQTKDGLADTGKDPDEPDVPPDQLFGYNRRPVGKKDTIERRAKTINRKTGVPLRLDRPDIPR